MRSRSQFAIRNSQFPIRIRKSIILDADATCGHLWHVAFAG